MQLFLSLSLVLCLTINMLQGMGNKSSPNQPLTAPKQETDLASLHTRDFPESLFSIPFSECSFYLKCQKYYQSLLLEKERLRVDVARLNISVNSLQKQLKEEKDKSAKLKQCNAKSHHYLHDANIHLGKQVKQHVALASIGLLALQSNNSEGVQLCLEQIAFYDIDDQKELQARILSGLQNISFCRTIQNRSEKLGVLTALKPKITRLQHFNEECIKAIQGENGEALKVLFLFLTQKDAPQGVVAAVESSSWVSTFIANLPKNYPTRSILLNLRDKRQKELKVPKKGLNTHIRRIK